MTKLIGITGKAGAGKDTAAAVIKAYLHARGEKSKQYSFADPLKEGCAAMFGIPCSEFYDRDKKEEFHPLWGKTRRELLLMVGTDMLRDQFDQEVWVKRGQQELNNNTESNAYTIIPDVRFDNEAEFVTNSGGVLLNIERSAQLRDVAEIQHKSEDGVDLTNAQTIMNDGTFEDLTKALHLFIDLSLPRPI